MASALRGYHVVEFNQHLNGNAKTGISQQLKRKGSLKSVLSFCSYRVDQDIRINEGPYGHRFLPEKGASQGGNNGFRLRADPTADSWPSIRRPLPLLL